MITKIGQLLATNLTKPATSTFSPLPVLTAGSMPNAIYSAKAAGGTSYYLKATPYSASKTFRAAAMSDSGSDGIYIGSGTTAATEDDYAMENVITSCTATITDTTVYDSENYRYIERLEITISNPTAADVTVSELGLFVSVQTASSRGTSTSANPKLFMVEHTVLATPVTVPAGEASVIRYDFIYPAQATT